MFKIQELPIHARSYVLEVLRMGNSLANAVAERKFIEHIDAIVPSSVSTAENLRLDEGLQLRTPASSATVVVTSDTFSAGIMEQMLVSNDGAAWVFENPLVRWTDPSVVALPFVVTHRSEVLHVVRREQLGGGALAAAMRAATSVQPLVGVLTKRLGDSAGANLGRELSNEQIMRIAESATNVVVGAFDGESYLLARLS